MTSRNINQTLDFKIKHFLLLVQGDLKHNKGQNILDDFLKIVFRSKVPRFYSF